MIIDLILDRKDGFRYSPREFYDDVMEYGKIFGEMAFKIARAMDMGEEDDVKRKLCNYIIEQGYNLEICDYINSVNWL